MKGLTSSNNSRPVNFNSISYYVEFVSLRRGRVLGTYVSMLEVTGSIAPSSQGDNIFSEVPSGLFWCKPVINYQNRPRHYTSGRYHRDRFRHPNTWKNDSMLSFGYKTEYFSYYYYLKKYYRGEIQSRDSITC